MTDLEKLQKFFEEAFREPWMNDEDYQEVLAEVFADTGESWEKLEAQLQVGVANGIPVDTQLYLMRVLLLRHRG